MKTSGSLRRLQNIFLFEATFCVWGLRDAANTFNNEPRVQDLDFVRTSYRTSFMFL